MNAYASRLYGLIFAAAAVYNIAFGLWTSLAPRAFFAIFRLQPPNYPSIWACLGMVVGLYGVGYAYAAWRLDRAFPFIAIGLAGKILGPIGWMMSMRSGELPLRTFPLIVFDDLIWWTPFALFLLEGMRVTTWLARPAPYLCAGAHIVAAIGTVTLLRNADGSRLGWALWMIAAISLLGFYSWWGRRVPASIAMIALAIASAGLLCDLAGESILMFWKARSRTAWLLSGAAGNGHSQIAITICSAILMTAFIPSVIITARKLA